MNRMFTQCVEFSFKKKNRKKSKSSTGLCKELVPSETFLVSSYIHVWPYSNACSPKNTQKGEGEKILPSQIKGK